MHHRLNPVVALAFVQIAATLDMEVNGPTTMGDGVMVGVERGRSAVRLVTFLLALIAASGCSCDDQLIDVPFEVTLGQPFTDTRLPVDDVLPPAGGMMLFATGGEDCAGLGVQLGVNVRGGTAPLSYEWTPATGLSDPTIPDPVSTTDEPITYTVKVTDARGQVQEARVEVLRLPLPTASIVFAAGANLTCAGGSVLLDGSGSKAADGGPVTLAWDLGLDGTTDGTEPSFAHTPTASTNVRLTVTDALGCIASAEEELIFRENPTPDIAFLAGGERVCSGDGVQLDGSGSVDADGNPVASFTWDTDGDGATTEGTAATVGPYVARGAPVSLTVTDALGCSASLTRPIAVGERPTAIIEFSSGGPFVCDGTTVALDGSSSHDASGGPVASYSWEYDGRPGNDGNGATTPAFLPRTTRLVRLVVADATGCTGTSEVELAVRGLPLAAISFAQGSANACEGGEVVLTGAGSRDVDGNPVAGYEWDVNADGTQDGSGVESASFVPAPPRQTARLVVTDRLGCSAATDQILQPQGPPRPVIDFTLGDASTCAGDEVALTGARSRDANGGPIASFRWDLDGDPATVESSAAATGNFVPDGHDAVLVVTDALGCTASATQPIGIGARPTAVIRFLEGADSVCAGSPVAFDGSGSTTAAGGQVSSYAWDLDGNVSTTESTVVRPPAIHPTSDVTVRLTVTDAQGCTGQATQAVDARSLPVVSAGSDHALCGGSTVQLGAAPTSGVSYLWTPATGISDPTASNPILTATTTGTWRVTATDATGCSASDEVAVGVHPVPVADAGPDRSVGRGGSVQLLGGATGGTPAYAWLWTPASTLSDPAIARPLASPTTDTAYTLRVTDSKGCTDTDEMLVSVVSALTVDVGQDELFCTDSRKALSISGTTAGGVAPLTYQWTANPPCGGCIATPNAATTDVTPTQDTVFTLRVTDANGFWTEDSISVDVRPSISVNAGPDQHIDRGEAVQIGESPAQAGLLYTWTCDNWSCGFSDPNVSDPWVAPEGTTAYKVTLTDGKTCTATDTVLVTMDVRVIATVPVEGHDPWPRDALIWIIFDTDVDPVSLAGNVSIWDPYTGAQIRISALSYDSPSRTLQIDPDQATFSRNNRPVLVVLKGGPTGVRTPGALPMSMYNDFFLTFNVSSMGDGAEPRSRYLHPATAALDVPLTTDIVLGFDEPVEPRTVTAGTLRLSGNITGTVTYDPRSWTATLRPSQPLAPNTVYTVTVNGVRDGSGNRSNWTWSFTTGSTVDVTPPVVSYSDPGHNVLDYDVAQPLAVTFSEPIDPATLGGVRLIDTGTGLPLSGEVFYDEATATATLDPHRLLEPRHTYRFEVSGLRDQAGNMMDSRYTASFTTANVVLLERFESNAAGWSLGSPWTVGYQGAVWGSFGILDSPGGDYAANASVIARSPALSVSGRSSVALSFWNRRAFANDTNNDRGLVEYSTNGSSWTSAGYVSDITGWKVETFTFPTGGASQLWFRLRLSSDAATQLDGWFVDELVVR